MAEHESYKALRDALLIDEIETGKQKQEKFIRRLARKIPNPPKAKAIKIEGIISDTKPRKKPTTSNKFKKDIEARLEINGHFTSDEKNYIKWLMKIDPEFKSLLEEKNVDNYNSLLRVVKQCGKRRR